MCKEMIRCVEQWRRHQPLELDAVEIFRLATNARRDGDWRKRRGLQTGMVYRRGNVLSISYNNETSSMRVGLRRVVRGEVEDGVGNSISGQ